MPGVDLALGPWPGVDEQRAGIERDLAGAVAARLCTQPAGGGTRVDVTLDNIQAGHAFPSGVTHARRVWVELVAEQAGAVIHESGVFGAGDRVRFGDPDAWVFGSRFLDAGGAEVAHAWEAAAVDALLLPPAVTLDPQDPAYYHAVTRAYVVAGEPDVVRMVVRIQPVGLDVLDRLVDAGELDPAVRDAMPTFELAATRKEWRRERDGWGCAP